eukprot:SM000047S16819  [mRNA]  locus=s47:62121:64225:- [translate_table: standard]
MYTAKQSCRLDVAGHGLLSIAIAAGVLAMHCSRTALAAAAHRSKVTILHQPPPKIAPGAIDCREVNRNATGQQQPTKKSDCVGIQYQASSKVNLDTYCVSSNSHASRLGAPICTMTSYNSLRKCARTAGEQASIAVCCNMVTCYLMSLDDMQAAKAIPIEYLDYILVMDAQAPEFRRAAAACTGASPNATECCTLLADVQDDLAILFPSVLGEAAIYPSMNAACTAGLQAALCKWNVTINITELCLEETGIQCINFMSNMCPATTAPIRVMQPLINACAEAVNSTSACGDCLHYLASGVASLLRRASSDAPANQTMANDCTKLLIVTAVHSEPLTIRGFSFIFRWRCQTTLPDL